MASINYSGLKKVELITIARRKKAPVTASMNKNEIIKAIKKAGKSKAVPKAKPVGKSKAKAKPVKKTGAKAKVKTKTKVVAKAKAKTKIKKVPGSTAKKKKSVVSKPARPSTPAKKKAVSVKKAINKPVRKVSRPAVVKEPPPKPASKKKAVSAKKTINKPAKKVSRPVVVKERSPKPASKKRPVSAKKTSIGEPAAKAAPLAAIKAQAPKPAGKKRDKKDWDIPMDAGKFFTADEQGDFSPEDEAQLPDGYGEDLLVALPKDPRSLFVYWEVLETSSEAALRSLGKSWKQVKWTLRVFDVTGLSGVEEAYHNFFDVTVDLEAGKRYLDVNGDGREYIVELGLIDDDNRFSSICLSNRVQTPRAALSAGDDGLLTEEAQTLYALSGGRRPGSAFIEETASLGVSSFGAFSGASGQAIAIREKHDFSMWVNCELTVYGGIAPGSRLVLQGQEINLRPDGAFSAKFHLPDGVQDIQVCGTSSDGVDSKEISLSVSRSSRIVR
ncbi:hypothetical protein MNBD_NITROSPINAE04-1679 [hydrothermal vent metagenome]|uniref:DUF4912 domain-containing protein n=1 Tax=hydrothermal vent metagenome TaxID=652676 RepID=A0A3B1CEJ2_9ZZZZ